MTKLVGNTDLLETRMAWAYFNSSLSGKKSYWLKQGPLIMSHGPVLILLLEKKLLGLGLV